MTHLFKNSIFLTLPINTRANPMNKFFDDIEDDAGIFKVIKTSFLSTKVNIKSMLDGGGLKIITR